MKYVKLKQRIGNSRGISIRSGENGQYQTFYTNVPTDVTEKQLAFIEKYQKEKFEIVDSEEYDKHITDHQTKEEEPEEKEAPKSEVHEDKDYTKEESYVMDRPEQEALLKARKVSFKATDKEVTLVTRILKSNPGYKA